MTVHLNFDMATAPPIEEQLNAQGATLGADAYPVQHGLQYCELLYIWGYLTQSEANKVNERIYKDVQANVRMMETEETERRLNDKITD